MLNDKTSESPILIAFFIHIYSPILTVHYSNTRKKHFQYDKCNGYIIYTISKTKTCFFNNN